MVERAMNESLIASVDGMDSEGQGPSRVRPDVFRRHSFPPHTSDPRSALPGFLFAASEDMNVVLQEATTGKHEIDPHSAGAGVLRPGSLASAIYTLCSISLGIGVFVLPVVLKDLGVISGLVALVGFGLWGYWAQMVLIKAASRCNPPVYSYEDLTYQAFGSFGKFFLSFFTAFTMLVGNAAHMKTVAQLLHDIIEWYVTDDYGHLEFNTSKQLILYIALLSVALVFCLGDRIGTLRYVSTASVTVVMVLCLWCTGECLFWYWPKGHHSFSGDSAAQLISTDWKSYALNLPAIAFTYSGTFCLFPVVNELEDRSMPNIRKAVLGSTLICCSGYMVVSLVGILTFGKSIGVDPFRGDSASNYLYVFPPSHLVVTFLCFLLTITITLLYPVINFPMLNATEKFIELIPVPACMDFRAVFLKWSHHRLVLTVLGMVVVVLLNLAFDSLVALFGFCGGWGVGFVVYFIPSCLYLRLCPDEPLVLRLFGFVSALATLALVVLFTYIKFF